MRFSGIRLPLLAATLWASVGLSVLARDLRYGETVYVFPTSTSFSVTAPYVVPRSYVATSSYMFPSYIATSYIAEPVSLLRANYIETTYRRGLFGRRWVVERPVIASYSASYLPTTYVSAYVPTTYVAPTYYATSYRTRSYRPTSWTYPSVWETAYSSAADICCDDVVVDSPVRSAPVTSYDSPASSRSLKSVESGSREDPTVPTDAFVNAPLPEELGAKRSTLPNNSNTKAQSKVGANAADSPPAPPAAASDLDDPQVKGTEKKAATPKTKAAPLRDANDIELQPAPGGPDGEITRRDSQRPNYAKLRRVDRRNILFGTVETDGGEPRGEVAVTVTNRNNSLLQHNGVSNAFGGFAIRVPDGQWTVKVTMPSGNIQTVRNITVIDGKVMDNLESREVYNLIISY